MKDHAWIVLLGNCEEERNEWSCNQRIQMHVQPIEHPAHPRGRPRAPLLRREIPHVFHVGMRLSFAGRTCCICRGGHALVLRVQQTFGELNLRGGRNQKLVKRRGSGSLFQSRAPRQMTQIQTRPKPIQALTFKASAMRVSYIRISQRAKIVFQSWSPPPTSGNWSLRASAM